MTYDFKCVICNAEKTITASMNDIRNIKPVCCDYPMQRVFNVVPVKFNGSGFHVNDYKTTKQTDDKGYCSSETHTSTTSAERSKILRED